MKNWIHIFWLLSWIPFHSFAADGAEPPGAGFEAKELAVQGGFEKGLAGWRAKRMKVVVDPTVAHGGSRCLLGEVIRRRTGAEVSRTLHLRGDRMYRLGLWAKADNRSRLTIWKHTGDRRQVIANWQHVPGQWRRYRVNFTVSADGPATIRIVAPSSFWAPTGRMWIDDVSLLELPRWEKLELGRETGFRDFPCLLATGQGTAWAAWLSFRDGRENLHVARLGRKGVELQPVSTWEVPGTAGAPILDPVLSGGPQGTWLVFSAEHDRNWDVFASRLDAQTGPAQPLRVTRDPGVDVHPAAAVTDGTLWITWESNRGTGQRQVYLSATRENLAGRPIRLSTPGSNNYQPSVVAVRPGELFVAWHSFRENNFDLYARRVARGSPGPEQRLTTAPAIDRGVQLAAARGDVWLTWELSTYTDYQLGKSTTKRVHVARLSGDRLLAPKRMSETRLWKSAESPSIVVQDGVRLWVAARIPRDRNSGWDVGLWQYARGAWAPPTVLSTHKGMNRRPGMALVDGALAIIYQGDDMPGRWRSVEESKTEGTSGVYLALVETAHASPENEPALQPRETPSDPFEAAAIRLQRGEDRTGWTLTHGSGSYRLLFGDLHEHSDLSVCDRTRDETPDQTYQMMRDVARYDFGGLTDHGKCFNAYLWNHVGKVTRSNADPGRFLSLLAQEWTSTFEERTARYPFGYYGHRNLIHVDPFFPHWYNAATDIDPAGLLEALRKDEANVVIIPHQLADTGNVPVDWSFHDERAEPVAEIFQMRGSYECRGCPREADLTTPRGHFLQDAWARGLIVGVVASPDHEGGFGKAAVYAESLTPEAIVEALRARRTYGTTGAKIFLDVRVNGQLMGTVGAPPGGRPVRVEVRVDCPRPIQRVDVFRNNTSIFQARVGEEQKELAFTCVDDPPPPGSYYYVRVIQQDMEMAWSSPVWLGRPVRRE